MSYQKVTLKKDLQECKDPLKLLFYFAMNSGEPCIPPPIRAQENRTQNLSGRQHRSATKPSRNSLKSHRFYNTSSSEKRKFFFFETGF